MIVFRVRQKTAHARASGRDPENEVKTMKIGWTIAIIGVVAAGWLAIPATAQLLGEQEAAMNMANTLDSASTGPSAGSVLNRVRTDLNAPAPGQPAPSGEAAGTGQTSVEVPDSGVSAVAPPGFVQSGTDEEGIPFALNTATQFANQGMAALRAQRFNEAVEAYRQAKESDPRYEGFYNKVVELRDAVNAGGIQEKRNEKVTAKSDVTWRQFLGWDRGQGQLMGYGFAPGLGGEGYPMMGPDGMYPMGPVGPAGPMGPMGK
jgi:hypothetical protein